MALERGPFYFMKIHVTLDGPLAYEKGYFP